MTGGDLTPWRRQDLAGLAPGLAPRLLGALVVSRVGGERVVIRLVEVEAYAGEADPASHAYRGPTPRNRVMFGPAGHAYVYLSYGMHCCMNVVCGPDGVASAVLLRAGTVVEGTDVAMARRPACRSLRDLARGPGRLCQALGVDRRLDGVDLCDPRSPLWLARGGAVARSRVRRGPRVGVSRAAERPWRFWVDGEPAVSAYQRAARAGTEHCSA